MNGADSLAAAPAGGRRPAPDNPRPREAWKPWIPGGLAVLGCLAAAAWHLGPEWTLNETYHYGWLVPGLAGYLALLRWRDRPPADPPSGQWLPAWVLAVIGLLVLWIVHEANPDWRLVGIALMALTVAVTLLWLRAAGGGLWGRHFAAAIGFLLLAAPWPTAVETAVTAPLMSANAGLALEALHWFGVPAVRTGSLISVPGATLGVEEACSGIRSLQATLMFAFFLGEMERLRWPHRLLLLLLGAATALATNVIRTVWLSALAAGPSPEAADRWHDAAGLIVLGIHAAVLLTVAVRLARRQASDTAPSGIGPTPRWPRLGPVILLASLASLAPFSAWWFGRHATSAPPGWTLLTPEGAPDLELTPIPPRTRQLLRYDSGWSARWRTSEGHQLQAFYLTWGAGQVPPEILHSHQPGNCLALAGMTLVKEYDEWVDFGTMPEAAVRARCLEFADHGRPLFVFHAVQESASRTLEGRPAEGLTYRSRLRAAWLGRRSEGLRLIEIGVWNAATAEEARAAASGFLSDCLRRDGSR